MFPRSRKGGASEKVQSKKTDQSCEAGDQYRHEVDSNALLESNGLGLTLSHEAQQRDEDVDAIGDGQES